tara:strand:- start:787 stop:1299 length:513 start_codon:yes stop_codon:yes gene_type:complete
LSDRFAKTLLIFLFLTIIIVIITLLTEIVLWESNKLMSSTPLIASLIALLGTAYALTLRTKTKIIKPENYSSHWQLPHIVDIDPKEVKQRIDKIFDTAIIENILSGNVIIKVPSMEHEIDGIKYEFLPGEIKLKKSDILQEITYQTSNKQSQENEEESIQLESSQLEQEE